MGESRVVLSLASILSFRMLGLFMIYPVFALYAPSFTHATSTLIGIAIGAYGLTQALLQLPLSMLSDRIGRRPVITVGLLVFALGSIVAASTSNIYFMIMGRALQGSGAIGSTIMAYAADVTSIQNRTKAMALLGMTIGVSFALAIVLGPIVNTYFKLSGIFWLTALFAISGILIQRYFIPVTQIAAYHAKEPPIIIISKLLKQSELLTLNISVLLLHVLLTASFTIIPVLFSQSGVTPGTEWKIYFPILMAAFVVSLPFIILVEKGQIKQSLLTGILIIGLGEFLFFYPLATKLSCMAGLFLFFTGFTLLEAILPSLVSKMAPINHKGSAMGIYSSFQFFGIFLGGALAGVLQKYYSHSAIFLFSILICFFWLCFVSYTKPILVESNV